MTVYYGSSVANGTISTACTMSTNTGGTETSKTSTWSGGNHFAEVWSQGGSSTPATSIPATPDGHGWVTAAPGAGTFATGNWSASIALALSSSATVSWTVRFFKYSSGSYTSIGTIATSAASLGTSRTVISFTATSMSSVTFGASDLLYVDLWMQDTTGAGGDNAIVYESNSSTAGVANDVQITTSTFTPAGTVVNKDLTTRGKVSAAANKDVTTRAKLSAAASKDVTVRGKLGTTVNKDVTTRGKVAALTRKDVTTRGKLSQSTNKDITVRGKVGTSINKDVTTRAKLSALGYHDITMRGKVGLFAKRDITVRGNIAALVYKDITVRGKIAPHAFHDISARGKVAALTHHDMTVRGNIIARNTVGGFTVWANGTGTTTVDHFRVTEFPDPSLNLAPVLPNLGNTTIAWDDVIPTNASRLVKASLDGVNWTDFSPGIAMTFDGSTGYISLPTTSLPTGASTWSLECWCKITAIPATNYYTMLGMGNNANQQTAQIKMYSNGTSAQFLCSTYFGDITNPNTITLNTSYHIIGTYDGTNIRLYVNGQLVAGPQAETMNLVQNYASIGADGTSVSEYFPGTIDECCIYTSCLSATQATTHYNAGVANATSLPYSTTVLADSPIRYYKLEDTNTTALDYGSQGKNGTLHGTITTGVPGLLASRNGQPISLYFNQPDPTIDYFNSNTSANYTNTSKSGGSAAAATYDTTNSRITLSGGSGGLYLNSTLTNGDTDIIADMDESDAGGLVWRYVDTGDYYELGAYDDSSSTGFTNQLRLYKVVSGTRSLIGSASTIAWPRSTPGTSPYKRIRVTMIGSTITVYFDGAVMQTATDSTFTSGLMGLRNDGGTSRYYQLRLQPVGQYVSGTPAGDIVTAGFVYTQVTLGTTAPNVNPLIQDLTTTANSPSVASGATIPQLHDPTKPFATFYSDEMDSLAQSSGDYYWAVNNSALTFAARQAVPAPWILYSTDLLFTPNVKPTFSADLYRNRQTITNVLGTVSVTNEQKIADGTATSWQMAYPLYSAPTITVQGVAKTIGVQGVDTGKDFYWQAASNSISQDASATVIPGGYVISVSYVGQFPTSVTRNNLAEQAARLAVEGGTGIVEMIEDGKQMLASAATTYADGLLARFSNNNTVEIQVTTDRAGLQKGQVVPTFIPEHTINNAQLLVTKVVTIGEQLSDGTILYQHQITATNGPNLSRWSTALGL